MRGCFSTDAGLPITIINRLRAYCQQWEVESPGHLPAGHWYRGLDMDDHKLKSNARLD